MFSISGDQAVKQEITFDLNEKVETEKSVSPVSVIRNAYGACGFAF